MRNESLGIYLVKPPVWTDVFNPSEKVELPEPVFLTPRHYAITWIPKSYDDVYTVYSPSQDRTYEDWEIEQMRALCASRGLRFQLHPPPISVSAALCPGDG